MPIILSAAAPKRHHIRDLVPYVMARIPYEVARPGSDGGETFHGRYKLQSPPSRRRRRLKAAAALISNPLYLPNDGNGLPLCQATQLENIYCLLNF